MTLQECYMALGGDYRDVVNRLRSDRLVQKFVLKFLDDDSYNLLCRSMAEKKYEDAFRAAHTIKGMCQNLSFTKLLEASSQLSDALRHGWTPEAEYYMKQVTEVYRQTVEAIRKFHEGLA